jgi:hypothetical protein
MNIEPGVLDRLIQEHGGKESDWFKAKGNGYIDKEGGSVEAELHWYKRDGMNAVDLKIKGWGHYFVEHNGGIRATSQYVLMEDGIFDTRYKNMITDERLLKVANECRRLVLMEDYDGFKKYLSKSDKELQPDQRRIISSTWIMEKGDEIFGILDSLQD